MAKVPVKILPKFTIGSRVITLRLYFQESLNKEIVWEKNGKTHRIEPRYKDGSFLNKFVELGRNDVFINYFDPDYSKILTSVMQFLEKQNNAQVENNKPEMEYSDEQIEKDFQATFSEVLAEVEGRKKKSEERKEEKKKEDGYTTEELAEIADRLMEEYHIVTVRGETGIQGEEVWMWKDGYYHKDGETDIRAEVKKELGSSYEDYYFHKVLAHIKSTKTVYRDELPSKQHVVNLLNGVLDYSNYSETKKIEFHERRSPLDFCNYNFTYIIPINYDTEAKCHEIDKIVNEILVDRENIHVLTEDEDPYGDAEKYGEYLQESGDVDVQESLTEDKTRKVRIFHDFLGSILMSDYRIKSAIVLLGAGNTGKSTIQNIAEQFAGIKNTCAVSIRDLDSNNNRFAGARLDSKLANIVDEMPRVDLKNVETFKNATGGKGFEAEKKGKDRFFMTNRAKMMFSANETPKIDSVIATVFFSRIVPVECLNLFQKGDGKTNINLMYKKYSDEELSGLLNHAKEGLERLLINGKYGYDESETPGIWNKYVGSENVLNDFIRTCLEVTGNQNDIVTKADMYNVYQQYHELKRDGTEELTINDFSEPMATFDPYHIKAKTVDDRVKSTAVKRRVRVKVWTGVKLLAMPRPSYEVKNSKTVSLSQLVNLIVDGNMALLSDLRNGAPTPANIKLVLDLVRKHGANRISDDSSEDAVKKAINDYCQKVFH